MRHSALSTPSRVGFVGIGVLALLLAAGCGSGPAKKAIAAKHPKAVPVASPTPPHRAATCPLSGQPAPGGQVPPRPALAVKIGNDEPALPQSGLDYADVVFEEPIEGGITRLVAVFQCRQAPQVGPIRSTRFVDSEVVARLSHPIFAYAGGIIPDENLIASADDLAVNAIGAASGAFYRSADRQPPENLYGSTQAMWGLSSSRTPPAPLFSYSAGPPAGSPVAQATLGWSTYYSVVWTWDPHSGAFERTEYGSVEHTSDGVPVLANNVLVLRVQTYPGPYAEDRFDTHGVRSVLYGSGSAVLLRNGVAVTGTWRSPAVSDPFTFATAAGATMQLAPGTTWVELLPSTGSFATTP